MSDRSGLAKHVFDQATQSVTINGKGIFCTYMIDGKELDYKSLSAMARAEGPHYRYGSTLFAIGKRVICRCRYCGTRFVGKPSSYYCAAPECVETHWRVRGKARRRRARELRVWCLQSYAKCKTCKRAMPSATRRTRRFCCNACRQKAHRNANSQTLKAGNESRIVTLTRKG